MDWLVGDELMRQWEEESKDEEEDSREDGPQRCWRRFQAGKNSRTWLK